MVAHDIHDGFIQDVVGAHLRVQSIHGKSNPEESAATGTKRGSKVEAGITAFLGKETQLPGIDSTNPLNSTAPAQLVKSEYTSEFDGEGDTKRTGKVTAEISAIVTRVFANGNLYIKGSQTLAINTETSLITVEGIVRPSDLSFGNKIESSRIANAMIEITGHGILSEQQKPGIVKRLLDILWPL